MTSTVHDLRAHANFYIPFIIHHQIEDGGCGPHCDISQLYVAVQVVVQPRHNRATRHILILILAMLCDAIPVWGKYGVRVYYGKSVVRIVRWCTVVDDSNN